MNHKITPPTRAHSHSENALVRIFYVCLPTWLLIPVLSFLLLAALWIAIGQPVLYAAAPTQTTDIQPVFIPAPMSVSDTSDNLPRPVASPTATVVTPTYVPYKSTSDDRRRQDDPLRSPSMLDATAVEQGPALVVTKTVGLDPGNCATTSVITVTQGAKVFYCYFVLNTGTVTFTHQSVEDSHLGRLLWDHEFMLTPLDGEKPAALFIMPSIITQTTTNVVTWTGSSLAGDIGVDTDSATVNVVSLHLTKTVGIKEDECATTSAITVTRSTAVYYCYTVENTSAIPLVRHTFQDSELDGELPAIEYVLNPGERFNTVDAGYAISDTEITSHTSTVTWKAFTESGLAPSAVATAHVYMPDLETRKTVGPVGQGCSTNSAISILVGTEVVYCYIATNTGSVVLASHTVVDSAQGVLLDNEPFLLAPGATVLFTTTQILTRPTTSEMTWTATANVSSVGGSSGRVEAESQSSATVSVIPRANFTAIVFDDLDQNGQQRDVEPGLSDVQVTLLSSSGEQFVDTTDVAGRSSFNGLAPGYYTVTVDVIWPGGSAITTTANVPTRVVLAGGESKSEAFGFDVSERVLLPLIVR